MGPVTTVSALLQCGPCYHGVGLLLLCGPLLQRRPCYYGVGPVTAMWALLLQCGPCYFYSAGPVTKVWALLLLCGSRYYNVGPLTTLWALLLRCRTCYYGVGPITTVVSVFLLLFFLFSQLLKSCPLRVASFSCCKTWPAPWKRQWSNDCRLSSLFLFFWGGGCMGGGGGDGGGGQGVSCPTLRTALFATGRPGFSPIPPNTRKLVLGLGEVFFR